MTDIRADQKPKSKLTKWAVWGVAGLFFVIIVGVLSSSPDAAEQPILQSSSPSTQVNQQGAVEGASIEQVVNTPPQETTEVEPKAIVPVVNTAPEEKVKQEAIPLEQPKYYENTYGNTVQSPTQYDSRPAGASARCGDGSYSFSQSRRGTCSHHGGVVEWY